jgi:DNA gyrase subunit A
MDIGTVKPVRLEDEVRVSYLDYAMSVIVSRSIPDVRDGLKPVHRRILYAMNDMGLRYNTPHRKCARIVGEVLGKYHPHGDAPVYEALVRMAQDFSMRAMLVDGQGNFGSVDNDPPAAMRYTEARLAKISQEMLVDIDKDTIDFAPNFDDSLKEPTVLPARVPNLLVNGSAGIAVGMATSIPPHNLGEVCDGVVHLIDNPDATVDDLLAYVKGPDFPTGGTMLVGDGREALRKAYATGQGKVVVQARSHVEETSKKRTRIVVTELPYQVNKAELVERIATLVKERKIEGISELRDESDRKGMSVVIELKKDTHPQQVLNNLYKRTSMRSSHFINMLTLVDQQPRVANLREILGYYVDFRREVVRRRSEFELNEARQKAHILEGLKVALDQLDLVIATIRKAPSAEAARGELMSIFGLSQVQAQAILDMQLRRLAALERQKILDDLEETLKAIAYLEGILADPTKLLGIVKSEVLELKSKYKDARRTVVSEEEVKEFRPEDLIDHQLSVVTLSANGYIKRLPCDTYRLQHRGGRGVAGIATRGADVARSFIMADTHDTLLFFSDKGKVYARKCYEVPQDVSRTAKGTPVVNLIASPDATEGITAIVRLSSTEDAKFMILATRRGKIKKILLRSLASIRSNGLKIMRLDKGDVVTGAELANEGDEIIMVSKKGEGARFSVDVLRTASRTSGGVRGLRLVPGDELVGMNVAAPDSMLLLVTELGYGKRTRASNFPLQGRGGKGRRAYRVMAKTGEVVAAKLVSASRVLMLISERGIVLRVPLESLPVQGRHTRGVILMRLDAGDKVVSTSFIEDEDSEKLFGQVPLKKRSARAEGTSVEVKGKEKLVTPVSKKSAGAEEVSVEVKGKEKLVTPAPKKSARGSAPSVKKDDKGKPRKKNARGGAVPVEKKIKGKSRGPVAKKSSRAGAASVEKKAKGKSASPSSKKRPRGGPA